MIKVVEKPWGKEEWLAVTEYYAAKILTVNPGKRLSLQYHEEKVESLYCDRGKGFVLLENDKGEMEKIDLRPGVIFHVPCGRKHRMECEDETLRLFEVSTPQLDDVVRVEDDYGRLPEKG